MIDISTILGPSVQDGDSVYQEGEAGVSEKIKMRLESSQANISRLLGVLSALKRMKRLELRGFKPFIDRDKLKETRMQWSQMEWVQFSSY